MAHLKFCKGCKATRTLEDFYLSKNGQISTYCKECSNARSRQYHALNREKRVAQIQAYRESHREQLSEAERARREDFAYREKCRVELKEWREKNKQHVKAYNRTEMVKARSVVNKAVRKGLLPPVKTMVCDVCDEAQAQHWHHRNGYDSDHYLDVSPVCRTCHGKEHWA